VDAVRHVDDPKLTLNADQRENGAWDFTDEDKQGLQQRNELTVRVEILEAQVRSLVRDARMDKQPAKMPPAKSPPSYRGQLASERLQKHHARIRQMRELGLDVPKNPSKQQLDELWDAHQAQQPMPEAYREPASTMADTATAN
jgi:hypothetical protein